MYGDGIALGIAFTNGSTDSWIQDKYIGMKKKISRWKGLGSLDLEARKNLLQTNVYGSMRYYLFSIIFPPTLHASLEEDARVLLWRSDPELMPDEFGNSANVVPFIKKEARPRGRKSGGAGEMDWSDHVEAFYAHWIRRYLDPRRAPWKEAADYLLRDVIESHHIVGRAVLLSPRITAAKLVEYFIYRSGHGTYASASTHSEDCRLS